MSAVTFLKLSSYELKIHVLTTLLDIIPDSAIPERNRALWWVSAVLQGATLNHDDAVWLVEALSVIDIGCDLPWLYEFLRDR